MRLDVLDGGHTVGKKLMFAMIRVMSRHPVPDVVKTLTYRGEFFGTPMGAVFQEVMRGPSEWTIGERELMAAYVSKTNECEFWLRSHGAVASKVMGNATVDAAIADVATAPISEKLRATLGFLRKVTREHDKVTPADAAALLALGVTRQQIEDALNVGFAFNIITRLADTFEFHVGPQSAFDTSAKMLLSRGYKL